jgi:hypothetical protein
MEYETWKAALINEIETVASWQAERVIADPNDPRFERSQQALRDLADAVRKMPGEHPALKALHREEQEIANLMRAPAGEPEQRYSDAKEEALQAYGFEQEPFASADQFLDLLRAKADETISEYRLRV